VNTTGVTLTTFTHAVTAGDPATWAFNLSQTARATGTIGAYTGVDAISPIDVSGTGTNTTPTTTQTAPTVTTTGSNRLGLTIVAPTLITTATAPAGSTERADQAGGTTTPTVSIETSDFPQTTTGATGTKQPVTATATTSATTTLTLKPPTTTGTGAATWYTFNSWQQPESTIEPSTTTYPNAVDRTYTASYTADRDIATELEPGNITRAYTYFTTNQLASITSKLGTATSASITYTRDLIGRQTKAVSGTSTIVSGYNDRDQPTQVTNGTVVTNYTYDPASRLATRSDQAGVTSFTYDNANRLATMADPLAALTSTYIYDYAGRTDTVVTGGSTRKYTYDRMGRILTDTNLTTTTPTAVLSTTNEWDNTDRLTKRTTAPAAVPGAGVETFTYDQASRLTSWTNQANVTTGYTWSATSNRTAAGSNTFAYNERNQLTTQTVGGTTSTYTYQPNGAQVATTTGSTTTSRTYDGLGRQTTVGATGYSYDALGRLTTAGTSTLGYAGLEPEPVTDNTVTYTRTPDGTINASKTGTTAALVTTNIHGDIAATINPATGTVTGRRTYDPTGVPIITNTAGNAGYQSQFTDPTTAEIHAQARNYQPTSARFTTRDTWTLPATSSPNINRYTYANANPITNTDPTGHSTCLAPEIVCTLAGFGDDVAKVGAVAKAAAETAAKVAGGAAAGGAGGGGLGAVAKGGVVVVIVLGAVVIVQVSDSHWV
jgi:large repetitive protein